jgi:D-methionine transport system ATP-binding protein
LISLPGFYFADIFMDHPFLLEARNITKRFFSKGRIHDALQNIDLCVKKGDIFGIIGQGGAGKSTLLRCLSHLDVPSSGAVLFKGQKIEEPHALRRFRQQTGMVFQHFQLLDSRTAAQNIAYPLEIAGVPAHLCKKRVEELLEWVGLSDKRDTFPAFLSGGQKQRVGIARALAVEPALLFCDEATSALDPAATRQILDLLVKAHKNLGLTIVLITHEMDVIRKICTRVAVLDQGKIIEQGSTIELCAHPQNAITQTMLQDPIDERSLPFSFAELGVTSSCYRLLKLRFRGQAAADPIIAAMIRLCQVDANILLGRLDSIQNELIGHLILRLEGPAENLQRAIDFLTACGVHCEFLDLKEIHAGN